MNDALTWTPTPDDLAARRRALAEAARADGLAALVIGPGADLRYLVGRTQGSHERMSALVLPADGDPYLITPDLERPGWDGSDAAASLEIRTWLDGDSPYDLLPTGLRGQRVAVDDYLYAAHVLGLQERSGATAVRGGEVIARQRMRKAPAEIAALEAIAAANDSVQRRVGEWLVPGRTEDDVRADVSAALLAAGHAEVDFCIIGSGPNGASPHHESSARVIQAGEPVVVDIGGPAPSGYFSDCTRTYSVGAPTDPLTQEVYDVVKAAQAAGVAAAKAGTPCEEVDAAARRVIAEAGYGEYFITRTGHGIGLECHEHPYQVRGNTMPLEPGMTFSVEPGIYLPGKLGVRIEDIVLVQTDGTPRSLNTCPIELVLPA